MKSKCIWLCVFLPVLLCFVIGCAPTPTNAQIETAILESLSAEASPPALDFDRMEVPMRSAGSANAVLWTADGEIQRNYTLEYDTDARAFAVTGFSTSRKSADRTYRPVPNDPNLVFAELAPFFDFSDGFDRQYLLLYAGEGDDLTALRTAFEGEKLTDMTSEQLASFEVCDLGGDALVLLVPRYEGLIVWINEIEHRGDMLLAGAEVARFENAAPVYIHCDFSDKLPPYEIHISLDGRGHFFTTNASLLDSIK